MSRTHPLDPLRPGFSMGRVTSGVIAGAVGGMAFGAMMLANFTINEQTGRTGMADLLMAFLGTDSAMLVFGFHMLVSVALGIVFSIFIMPQSYRSSILWALGYVVVAGFIGSQVILRKLLVGAPFDPFDAGAIFALVGHLVYGVFLGVVYVSFHNLEIREALDAQSEKWRDWGRHEREDMES
ncbi:MAG TPA: hypothetical protein VM370_12570 [Candidatus Thermoplasmatota archaeon]|nr:hypothetical protein [Candidatus Thermoplasmatota archaeon]